jgi:hypothetical protein
MNFQAAPFAKLLHAMRKPQYITGLKTLVCASLTASTAFGAPPPSSGGPDGFGYRYSDSRPTIDGLPTGIPGYFGDKIAISGSRVVVRARFDGTFTGPTIVYVFDRTSPSPSVPVLTIENPALTADSSFGTSVAIVGSRVVIGAGGLDNQGVVYVYDLGGITPAKPVLTLSKPSPQAGDGFGGALAIDGDRLIVGATGASGAGSAYVYDLNGPTPTVPVVLNNPNPVAGDAFGASVAISGERVVVGAPGVDYGTEEDAGKAYAYDLATSTVPIVLNNPTPNGPRGFGDSADRFGISVAISGTRAVVGAPFDDAGTQPTEDRGIAYVFDLTAPASPLHTLSDPIAPNLATYDYFGRSVAIFGNRVVVGVPQDNYLVAGASGGDFSAGSAYIYDLGGASPTVPFVLNNPFPGDGDGFGSPVVMDGDQVAIAASQNVTGVANGGSVYLYNIATATPVLQVTLNQPEVYPDTPLYGFSNLSVATGASVATQLTGDDSAQAMDIGFSFKFYDQEYSVCYPSTNGLIKFGSASTVYTPRPIRAGTVTLTSCSTFGGGLPSQTVTCASTAGLLVGMTVSGSNIAPGSKIITINNPTTFTLDLDTTGTGSSLTLVASTGLNNFIAPFWTDLKQGTAGKVLYQTVGGAPNRTFIITYEDFEQFEATDGLKITFQVKLFEGSNAIEFHYKKIDAFTVAKNRTIGIEDPTGTMGLQYKYGSLTEFNSLPPAPFSVRFERSIFVEVESIVAMPGGSYGTIGIGGKLTPRTGRVAVPYASVQTFEAPEFIYLNKDLEELSAIGAINETDPDKIAYYRARNLGYAIDGEAVQGVERFFERTINQSMKVIWRWELEYAVNIESATDAGDTAGGFGNPVPGIGRVWLPKDSDFSAAINSTVENDGAGFRFSTSGYVIRNEQGMEIVSKALSPTDLRVVTDPIILTGPRTIKWLWTGQVRYRFDALGGTGTTFADQAFVQIGPTIHKASGPNRDVWVNTGSAVTVGAFYRTDDNCYTLADFPAPLGGDLVGLGADISNFGDVTVESRVARTFTVAAAERPTQISWLYQPTVFRAEVPLGLAFDPTATVPVLCGATPVLHDAGPDLGSIVPVGETPTGTGNGTALRFDKLAGKLYPVRPGSNRIQWRDQNDTGKTYQIEIVSGYPGDVMPLASERENANGSRQGSAPAYVRATPALADVAVTFPAAPAAHYRHLVDPNADRRPPTKLDLDPTDEWAFKELTYTDQSVEASVANSGQAAAFSATGAGRSVVLYSYRENPDEIADGNLTKEKLAVRVVQSSLVNPVLPDDPRNILGRRGLALDGSAIGIVQKGGTSTTEVDPGSDFVVDFWLTAKGLRPTDTPVKILTTQGGNLEVTLDAATSSISTTYFGTTTTHPFSTAGATWRHCVVHVFTDQFFGFDITVLDFYVDGVRQEQGMFTGVATATSVVGASVGDNSLRLGVGADPLSKLMIDQVRLFTLEPNDGWWLGAGELAALRTGTPATLRSANPILRFNFEAAASSGSFANGINPLPNVGLAGGTWARLDIQEVATRLDSTLDNAGFGGSGYILNAVSNYNANLYNRSAEVGAWGPIFPVNHGQLYLDATRRLEVAYYENPFLTDPALNPNVAWPYLAAAYDEVKYPAHGPHKDKATYIASRIGSEGVDQPVVPSKSSTSPPTPISRSTTSRIGICPATIRTRNTPSSLPPVSPGSR